jgi:hypothetical protein
MAELMFGLGQTKKKQETNAKMSQAKKEQYKYQGRPDEDAEAASRKEHFSREQGYKATQKETKGNLKDVTINETVESGARKEQFSRDQGYKATQKETRSNLKDVNMTDTVESENRKEQNTREKDWKAAGKAQKDSNTNFDMARALFS